MEVCSVEITNLANNWAWSHQPTQTQWSLKVPGTLEWTHTGTYIRAHTHTQTNTSELNKPLKLTQLPPGVICQEVLTFNMFHVFDNRLPGSLFAALFQADIMDLVAETQTHIQHVAKDFFFFWHSAKWQAVEKLI